MFKSARWRSEKNRIKVVFKLQFHATQVSQLNADGLTLSLVPGDVGKPTGRPEKAVVRDGSCRWESPVYETVKFHQDVKTGKVNQKIYHIIVSTTGSGKAGLVGETSIDFADYADAIKTCNASLTLQNSNSKALLHVTIQRQLGNVDLQRVLEESENLANRLRVQDLKSHLSTEADDSHKSDSQEENPFGKVSRTAELRRRASIESDTTLSSFDSVSELDAFGEVGNRMDQTQQNHPTFEEPHISECEWSGSSDHGISTDDSTNSSNDIIPRDTSDDDVEKLKAELVALARRADLSELELQSVRKQIVKETKRSQDLLKEVTSLKQERDTLKADCEQNKASDKRKAETRLQFDGIDPQILLEELDHEKDLNSNLRLQLQKTQESNTELLLAVQDLEAMLVQRNKRAADLPKPRTFLNTRESSRRSCTSETDDDEDQKALDELVKGHMDAKEAHVLEQRISDLYNDIEIYKRDKEDLEIQIEQLALDYEILKQENHDISYKLEQSQVQEQLKMQYECSSSLENHVGSLEAELKIPTEEFSESLCRIKELETHIESLEVELEKQIQIFEADIEAVTVSKVEQEKRAIQAEEALRKTKLRNADLANKLQDEFKRFSRQMASTLAANEKTAMKAMTESRELRIQKRQLEEVLMNANDELRANKIEYEVKLYELTESADRKTKEMKRMLEDENTELNKEIIRLRNEIEILKKRENSVVIQAENLRIELEETIKSSFETEALVQKGNIEKNQLTREIESMKKHSRSLAEELQRTQHKKDEQEAAITLLKSELETVRSQFDGLKHSLSAKESEIENQRKELVQVRTELKKKNEEEEVTTKTEPRIDKKSLKPLEENTPETSSNMLINKEMELKNRIEELQTSSETCRGPAKNGEVLQSNKSDDFGDLVSEVTLLKDRNGIMEIELKEMQERYSEISLRFAEVEGERQQLVMRLRNLKNAKKN